MKLYPVVILAGGEATRLRPLTERIPKALVEVGGKPFIAHQLILLKSRGIRFVVISAWYKGEMIHEYVGDGSRFDINVQYSFDGEHPLGTGGAVRKALPLLDTPFFVLYGDSYLPCNYAEIQSYFDHYKKPGLMTVYRNEGKWDTSNVEVINGQIVNYDKVHHNARMEYIDYGLGLFDPSVFLSLPEDQPADLAEIYQELITSNNLLAFEAKRRFYEIGTFKGLSELNQLLTNDPNQFLQKEDR